MEQRIIWDDRYENKNVDERTKGLKRHRREEELNEVKKKKEEKENNNDDNRQETIRDRKSRALWLEEILTKTSFHRLTTAKRGKNNEDNKSVGNS